MIIIDYAKILKNSSIYFVDFQTLKNIQNDKAEKTSSNVPSIFVIKIEV